MVECQQILRELVAVAPIDGRQTLLDLANRRGFKPRARHADAQRVGVAAAGDPPKQGSLYDGCAPPHEWVIDNLAGRGQAFDEEAGQLRLEAGPVGNLVQAVCSPLLRRPERIHASGNGKGFPAEKRGLCLDRKSTRLNSSHLVISYA